MSPKCSAGPPAASSGSPRRRLRLRALSLLLFPLLSTAALRLPYAPLQAHLASLAGVRLTDRHGRLLAAIPGARGAFSLRLGAGEIPPEVERIFVRLEDRRFFGHRGVDPLALARAARDNLRRGGVVSGASTISMQLARLLDPHRGGWPGKLRESLAALRLETVLDKREILRLYLKRTPSGSGRAAWTAGRPPALEAARICALTGCLASPACPSVREELFRPGTLPRRSCPVHGAGQSLEELALELFLEGGKGPRVLYPRDGASFYHDGVEAAQDIPAWIAARRQETLEVRLNGESRALKYPFRLDLPVRPGNYLLEVIGAAGRDAVHYQVR